MADWWESKYVSGVRPGLRSGDGQKVNGTPGVRIEKIGILNLSCTKSRILLDLSDENFFSLHRQSRYKLKHGRFRWLSLATGVPLEAIHGWVLPRANV